MHTSTYLFINKISLIYISICHIENTSLVIREYVIYAPFPLVEILSINIKKINQKKKLTSSKLQMWEHLLQLQQRNKRPCFWQWVCKAEQLFPALLKRLSWQRKNLTTPNLASKHQNLYQVFSFAKKNINNPKFSIETTAKSLPSLPIQLQ